MIDKAGYKDNNLITFNWYVTNFCNYRCTYCAEHDILTKKLSDTELESYRRVLPVMKSSKIKRFSVELIGGEPTLHPNLKIIMQKLDRVDREKFIYCELITNLSRSENYFHSLFSTLSDRFVIKPSYHPQYYTNVFMDKIKALSKCYNVRPTVVVSDDTNYTDQTKQFLDTLIDEQIEYDLQLLYCTSIYKTGYTNSLYLEYKKYFDHNKLARKKYMTEWSLSDMNENIPYTVDGNETTYNMNNIKEQKLNMFAGYSCTPNYWEITSDGNIYNSCTREKLKYDLSNIYKKVTCPVKSGCHELHKLYYYKTRT